MEQGRQLAAAGIDVCIEHVERIDERDAGMHIVLHGHPPVVRDALFIQPQLALASDLAVTLGAEVTDAGTVAIDLTGQSSVPGLYIAGDAATPVQSVTVAAGTEHEQRMPSTPHCSTNSPSRATTLNHPKPAPRRSDPPP